tara:strand:+ start:320 stop:769 length:450 start_codon:yes stop_codon:yes gene_type:complete
LKIALFGPKSYILERALSYIQTKYLGSRICAAIDGYSGFEGILKFKSLCKDNAADIVLVAWGHPLQDQLIIDFKKDFSPVFVGAGGSFDVWSGLKKRAPRLIQMLGLEWAFRILQDPTPNRIRRFFALPLFVLACLRLWIVDFVRISKP